MKKKTPKPSELHTFVEGCNVTGHRTIEEWYQFLPKDIRKKAMHNAKGYLNVECVSLSSAISSGFVWEETRQGHDYWQSINNLVQIINPRP